MFAYFARRPKNPLTNHLDCDMFKIYIENALKIALSPINNSNDFIWVDSSDIPNIIDKFNVPEYFYY